MHWTEPHRDLDGLIYDLRLPPYPTVILRRHLGGLRSQNLRNLLYDVILASDPYHLSQARGPRRTPYAVRGGRCWRMAVALQAGQLLTARLTIPTDARDLVTAAVGVRSLGADSVEEHGRFCMLYPTSLRVRPGIPGSPTSATLVRLAAYAADRCVDLTALSGPDVILPAWADPYLAPMTAGRELIHQLRRLRSRKFAPVSRAGIPPHPATTGSSSTRSPSVVRCRGRRDDLACAGPSIPFAQEHDT